MRWIAPARLYGAKYDGAMFPLSNTTNGHWALIIDTFVLSFPGILIEAFEQVESEVSGQIYKSIQLFKISIPK